MVVNMKLFKQLPILITSLILLSNTIIASIPYSKIIDKSTISINSFTHEKLKGIKELLDNGKTQEALNKLHVIIDAAKNSNDTLLLVESTKLLADIYRENGDYKKSTDYFNEIIPLIDTDYEALQYVLFKKGGNFQLDGLVDSALVNYEKAVIIGDKVQNHEDLKAKVHGNLSGIYYLKENYSKAIQHSKIAADYQNKLGNKEIEAGILNNLGSIYYMQGKYKEALQAFKKSLSIVGFGQEELQKQTRNSSFINMAYAYSALKNYKKAFEYQDKYFSLNDSLQQELKYKEIAEIESKYKVVEKEKEAEIEKTKRLKAEYLLFGFGFAIFILLSGIFALYKLYKLNKKNHALQVDQDELVHQNTIEKIKSNAQSKILAATLDGRLEERKKIASVLHDNVSALLSAANLHLYAGSKQIKGKFPVEIEKTQAIISEASEQIRDLSHNLISSVLLKFGLNVAIQDLCEKSSNSVINLTSTSKNIVRFNQNFEIKIFNIITEMVNNMIKHSKATHGAVKMEQLNGKLQLIIFDDGVGFDIAEINEKSGIGLNQVKARISVLNGIIDIKSSNSGTRIYISVPIEY